MANLLTAELEILDPTAGPEVGSSRLAPRPTTLAGKTLALLANGKRNSDLALEFIGQALVRDFGVAALLRQVKPTPYRPAAPELLTRVQQACDLVLTGVGD